MVVRTLPAASGPRRGVDHVVYEARSIAIFPGEYAEANSVGRTERPRRCTSSGWSRPSPGDAKRRVRVVASNIHASLRSVADRDPLLGASGGAPAIASSIWRSGWSADDRQSPSGNWAARGVGRIELPRQCTKRGRPRHLLAIQVDAHRWSGRASLVVYESRSLATFPGEYAAAPVVGRVKHPHWSPQRSDSRLSPQSLGAAGR